jgi:spore germination cell wall hydrolase CwlJ-like protein
MTMSNWLEPDVQAMVDTLPDSAILALTLFGEARSEDINGIVAVGHVIQQRAADSKHRWPTSVRAVCLQPFQFSCWNVIGGQRNFDRVRGLIDQLATGSVPADVAFEECSWVAAGLRRGSLRNRIKNSTHYHVAKMMPRPKWAQQYIPAAQVGSHVFYNTVP